MNSESRNCQNCKKEFTIEPEDFVFYEKMKVPPPTWCPECRMIRRMTFRNERNLFRVKDAFTGKEIFSGIPPQAPVKVYNHDYWWSDKWDPMVYGREYDFSRPFFDQLRELMLGVPFPARNVTNMVNSDYSDHAGDLKNSYLCFNGNGIEDSAYILNGNSIKNSFDITDSARVELSYDSLTIANSYQLFFCQHCADSRNLWFCKDCIGCTDCVGSVNLRNKQYHIFNKPYSRSDYFAKLKELNLNSYKSSQAIQQKAEAFFQQFPNKYIHGANNENSLGDYINNSKNVTYSFGVEEGENLKYCQEIYFLKGKWEGGKDSYDYYNWGMGSELMYEVYGSGRGCRNVRFCLDCWPAARDLEYSLRCVSSANCFGCVGLKKKSYCILNKQYSPQEYTFLREKIIAHMNEMPLKDSQGRIYRYGELFPPSFSFFAYNETPAQDYFPLSKDEALHQGYQWKDIERKEYHTTKDAKDLPDKSEDTLDSVLKEIFSCTSCKRAYRIIASEFEFLRKQGISFPRLCPDCRYRKRFSYRNRPRYYQRSCMCGSGESRVGSYKNQVTHTHGSSPCKNEFTTSYDPNRSDIIYCEPCYQAEVV